MGDLRGIIVLTQGSLGNWWTVVAVRDAMENPPQNEPCDVVAEDGEVIMEGPNGQVVSFTPPAALETSERLLRSGLEAQGQIVEARRRLTDTERKD